MRALRSRMGDDAGISLVETLVVMAILAVVSVIALQGVVSTGRAQTRQVAYTQTLNEAKTAFERVTRDIRSANPIEFAAADEVRFRMERPAGERVVTIALAGSGDAGRLTMRECPVAGSCTAAPLTLIEGVRTTLGPAFGFRDSDGNALSGAALTPELIHSIDVRLPLLVPRDGGLIDLRNQVQIRNAS